MSASKGSTRQGSRRTLVFLILVALGLLPSAPALADPDISITIDTVVRGAEGTTEVVVDTVVDQALQGSTCVVTAVGLNQPSVHPNSDLIVASGGSQVTLFDVERAPDAITVADGELTLGATLTITVRIGEHRVFSGGIRVDFECTPPPVEASVSVTPGVCVPETSLTPVVVVIDPASGATVTIEGPGGPHVVTGSGGTVDVGPGDYSWSAVVADGFVLVGEASGTFTAEDCSEEPPVEPPEVCDASIGDLVWLDVDADGVQDAGEVGVSGVTVQLVSGEQVVETTLTDADGRYGFGDLCPGTYQVVFQLPDLPDIENEMWTTSDTGTDDLDSDADATGSTVAFELTEGETDLTWDAGIFGFAVSPTQVTPPPAQVTPPAQTTLPETGVSSEGLAVIALLLIGSGFGLVRRSSLRGPDSA